MLNNVLFIILGAGLASIGFLGAALAERLRTPRVPRETVPRAPRETVPRAPRETVPRAPTSRARETFAIPVVEAAELLRPTPPTRAHRAHRVESKIVTSTEGGDDVIAALVTAGYKRPVAAQATWACELAERATIGGWTAAALRRCARGGLS